jgi:histidinol-phosphate aminotransferase
MANVSRRQILLVGGALIGAGMLPGHGLYSPALAKEMERVDYVIRMATNENPWGPSRVALQAMADSMKLTNQYGGDPPWTG